MRSSAFTVGRLHSAALVSKPHPGTEMHPNERILSSIVIHLRADQMAGTEWLISQRGPLIDSLKLSMSPEIEKSTLQTCDAVKSRRMLGNKTRGNMTPAGVGSMLFFDLTKPAKPRPKHRSKLLRLKGNDRHIHNHKSFKTPFRNWIAQQRRRHRRNYQYCPQASSPGRFRVWLPPEPENPISPVDKVEEI